MSKNLALAAGCSLVLAGCGFMFAKYPTENPRDVGRTVDRLRQEMLNSITVKPTEPVETFAHFCGEDWEEEEKVAPLREDPWKVDFNQYNFRVDFITTVAEGVDAPPIYQSLLRNLRKIEGWDVHEQRAANGFLNGIGGEKDAVSIHAFHSPNEDGNISVHVYLQTKCYKHPNA